jgi:sensory rhodopsin
MVDPVTAAYGFSVAVLVCGVGIGLLLLADESVDNARGGFAWLLIIPGFAALSYVLMGLEIGTVTVAGDTVYLFRYVDWIVTTPVLVGYVGYVAGAPRKWILGVALADGAMIGVGLGATLTTGVASWVGFGASALFHLVLLGILYLVFPQYAQANPRRRRLFEILQNHVGLLWIAYPVIWLTSPAGLGYVSVAGTAMIIAYLDAVAKTPYVYFVWRERFSFADERPSEESPPSEEPLDDPGAPEPTT